MISVDERLRLAKVALGLEPADLWIANGRVVNVYSGEVTTCNVAIAGNRIAYVGQSQAARGPETQVWDASDYFLIPGLIDAHAHLDLLYHPHTYMEAVLPTGTTTVFSNCWILPMVFSPEDYHKVVARLAGLPLRVFSGIPAEVVNPFYGAEESRFSIDVIDRFTDLKEAFGLAEVCFDGQINQDTEEMAKKIDLVIRKGKRAQGHLAGSNDVQISAAANLGLSSCHEAITAEEALERLRAGIWVMLRHSPIRPDLGKLVDLITKYRVDTSRLILLPDGRLAIQIEEDGYLDGILREAIKLGVDPVTAIQMMTRNPAVYFRCDEEIGAIAPGRRADLVFVRDLNEPRPEVVVVDGRKVAEKGELLEPLPPPGYLAWSQNKYLDHGRSVLPLLDEDTFLIPARGLEDSPFPAIRMVNNVITNRADVYPPIIEGRLAADSKANLAHISLVNVEQKTVANGFLVGFGTDLGGLASTGTMAQQLLVIGHAPVDMLLAAEEALKMGGGIVVADRGRILFRLPLLIGGIMSGQPMGALAAELRAFYRVLKGRGFPFNDGYFFLSFLSLDVLPNLRITTRGIVDVVSRKVLYPSRKLK